MFDQLVKMIATAKDERVQELEKDNEALHDKICDVLNENYDLKEEKRKLQESKRILLDEIVSNQKRIDSLLRQLSEKNGGK